MDILDDINRGETRLARFLSVTCSGRYGWTESQLQEICVSLRIPSRGNKSLLCRKIREKLQEQEPKMPENPVSVLVDDLLKIEYALRLDFNTLPINEQSLRVLAIKEFIVKNEILLKKYTHLELSSIENERNFRAEETRINSIKKFFKTIYRMVKDLMLARVDEMEHEKFFIYLRGFIEEDEEDLLDALMSVKDVNSSEDDLDVYTPFISSKCKNTDIVMSEEYEINDKDDVFIMYKQKSDSNKFNDDGICVSKTDIKEYLKSDLSNNYSNLLMCIWTGENLDKSGKYGKPSGRVVVKVPPYNTYITYGSFENMMKHDYNKEWYLYPLYNGYRRRIGNLNGSYGSGRNHGQIPGSKIYKAYNKKQIVNGMKIKEEYSDYPIYMYENTKPLNDILNTDKQLVKVLLKNLIRD